MKLHPLRQRPLALALHLAIAVGAPSVAYAEQLIVIGDPAANADGKTFDTGIEAEDAGIAVLALSGGKITGSDVVARSGGENTATVVVADDGSTIELSDSQIVASGPSSFGAIAADGGSLKLRDTRVTTTNTGTASIVALGGSVLVEGGTVRSSQGTALVASGAGSLITTQDTTIVGSGNGQAVVSSVDSGRVTINGGSIESNGSNYAAVLHATGEGSRIDANGVAIEAFGSGTLEAPNAVAVAQSGGQVALEGANAHTYGSYANGLWSEGGGSRITASGTTIATEGASAVGVLARDEGTVVLDDATLSTSNADADGLRAFEGGSIEADGTTVSTSGETAYGVYATQSGKVDFQDGSIATTGDHSDGVHSTDSAQVTLNGTKITTSGVLADAVQVGGKAVVNGTDLMLETSKDDAYGVYVYDAGSATLDNTNIATQGELAYGIGAVDPDSRVAITGGSITTAGKTANGLDAYLGATVTAKDVTVTTHGEQSMAVSAFGAGSRIDVDGATIVTDGPLADGATANTGGEVRIRNSSVTTSGEAADGLSAVRQNSLVEGDNVNVKVSGADAAGATAVSGGTVRVSNGSRIESTGSTPYSHAAMAITTAANAPGATFEATDSTLVSAHGAGVAINGGATARLTNTTVEAGRNALGYEAPPAPLDAPATITVDGGRLHSAEATIDVVSGKGSVTLSNGVKITSNNGVLAQVNPDAALTLNMDNVRTTGNLIAGPSATLDFNLSNGSALTGTATNAGHATIDSTSLWTLTGNSVVASMRNGGTIGFAAPAGAGFKTLEVTGDYVGDGGRLVLNTVLGGDASATDKLIVHGDTEGATAVTVNNVGGAGAQTSNGIQVVQVDGASNGTFALAKRATAGAYEYLLYKGGVATPTDGDWYLRSEVQVVPTPVVPTPVTPDPTDTNDPAPGPAPVAPVVPTAPLYRPEPAAYLANQAAAVGMFAHSMHDRMGEPNLGAPGDDGRTSAAWARVVRNQMDGVTGEGQLDAGTDTSVLQIGGEIARGTGDRRFHVGLMGGTGRANTDVTSNPLPWRAKGKVVGYNLGLYGTWFANANTTTGLYLDGWLQYGRYDNKVQGDYLASERYDSSTWAGSIEAGYAFALNDGDSTRFFVEPQAQAIFTDYTMSQHREENGTLIDDVDAGGLTTRLGVRFYGHAASAQRNLVQPFVTLNWWHDDDGNRMAFNTTTLELQLPRDRYEAKLGLQTQLGSGWTGWGNLGLAYGAGDYHDVTGQLGLNYRW